LASKLATLNDLEWLYTAFYTALIIHPRPAISEAKAKARGSHEAKAKQVNLRLQGQDH